MTLGLERAGFRTLGGIDSWDEAASTFEHNLSLRCYRADLATVAVPEIESFFGVRASEIDVLAGGPPCQGFSTVGKRDAEDPRNKLWTHFLELVAEIRPAYVLIENVEGLVVMDRGRIRTSIINGFSRIGYHMVSRLLRAADYGVPQLRKRVVFLGWLPGLTPPKYPPPVSVRRPVTVAEAMFDLPSLQAGESAIQYTKRPETEYQKARRKACKVLHNHEAASHPPRLVEILRHIPDGGNRRSIPDALQPTSGFHNSYARLSSLKPAIAVTSNMRKPSSARATHPRDHRGLTVREGLRLQSFDDDFIPLGSRTSQYLQVGNAVPPLLAEQLGRQVLRAFESNTAAAMTAARATRTNAPAEVLDDIAYQLRLSLGAE